MNADEVIDALIDYMRSAESHIKTDGTPGQKRKALVRSFDKYIDARMRHVRNQATVIDPKDLRR